MDEFSAVDSPAITLSDYIYRLAKSLDRWFYDDPGREKAVGIRSLLISLVYIDNIKERVPDFELTVFNQHRLFAVTMLLAAKFTEDCIIANSYWAETAGLELSDLNTMERKFCEYSNFDFFVSDKQLRKQNMTTI
eukprot:CAMPEP_0184032894 /NCGR_PEP_ID=MMETSP0955-20130417/3375_1 /TAXON_ID=627963 /ORGANISM="Aplanochytrium sp, Strain PBS07" /LENGTH=134 /DNA_ID=CAMNT_0026319107 /DNA_START=411 /DNA_END=816 /DNA_ORIENTATION=+